MTTTIRRSTTYTQDEMLHLIDQMLVRQATRVRQLVEQLGSPSTAISSEGETLRQSPLGKKLLDLAAYLHNQATTPEEKQKARRSLSEVLNALFGMARVPLNEDFSEFGEWVNALRVKDTKMPEVLNVQELIQVLNEHAGPKRYFLVDVYALRRAQRLWPLRVHGKPRYFRNEALALCQELQQEQQEANAAITRSSKKAALYATSLFAEEPFSKLA